MVHVRVQCSGEPTRWSPSGTRWAWPKSDSNIPQAVARATERKQMETQQSRTQSSFSPFRPGLKFESTNPVDPPDNTGGGGGTTTPSPAPSEPQPTDTEEAGS